MAYQADIRISVKGGKQIDQLSKAVDKLTPQINAANAAFIRFSKIQRENLPLIANFSRVLRENQKVFASTILSNKEATTAAKNQAIAERELNNELARRNAVLNKARGIKSDAIAKSIARNQAKFRDPSAPAFENLRNQPSGAKRPSRFAQFSQDALVISAPRSPVDTKIKSALADIKTEKRVVKEIADIRKRSASKVEKHNKRRVDREKQIKAIFKDADKINDKRRKILRQDARVIKEQIAESAGGRFRRFQRNRTLGDKRIRRDTLSSAAIGGAFPLLFGQGPLAAAGGAAGGFAGGIIGGQAAFALSLVGTQIGSAISQLVSGAAELGKAIGPFTQDTKAVTSALGLQGSAQEKQLQLIEQVEGKTQAFNAATGLLARKIGQNGVTALQEFGESSRLLSSAFSVALVRLQAFTAGILDFILKITGAKDGLAKGEANDLIDLAATRGNTEALALIQEQKRITAIPDKLVGSSGGILGGPIPVQTEEAKNAQKTLDRNKRILAIKLKEKTAQGDITVESDLKLKKLREENDLQERIKENSKTMTKDLAEKVSKLEQEFDLRTKTLKEVKKFRAKEMQDLATQVLLDGKISENEKIQLENAEAKFVAIGELLDENNLKKAEGVKLTKDLHTEANKVADAFESLGLEILDSVKDGIKGLIKGTSTLSDLLNNVADKFLDVALNQAFFGSILGSKSEPKGGIFGALGLFADGGRPPVNRPSIVGEKGPELFVPRSSGNIIPNNKLGGGGNTSVVVNVDASGTDVQGDEAQAKELGTLISVAVKGELVKQQRPGGLLSRTI